MSSAAPNVEVRPIGFCKLRITLSIACGVMCVVLLVLWLLSYWWAIFIQLRWFDTYGLQVTSAGGRLSFFNQELHSGMFWPSWRISGSQDKMFMPTSPTVFGFHFERVPQCNILQIPHWFTVLASGVLAVAIGYRIPWLPYRFSLRTLLIATTLIAVGLGMVVWMMRSQ